MSVYTITARTTTDPRAIALEKSGPIWPDMDLRDAKAEWAAVRARFGMPANGSTRLITKPSAQMKCALNATPTWSLSLAAGAEAGFCVNSRWCFDICVVEKGGRAKYPTTPRARRARSELLVTQPRAFARLLLRDIEWAEKNEWMAGRLNANSDVAWERVFPWVFTRDGYRYDYTKRIDRVGFVAPDYRVIFSATRFTRRATIDRLLGQGDNVAVILPLGKTDPKPATLLGHPVLDGDVHDDRFIEPGGHIVALRWKAGLIGQWDHPMVFPHS